MRHFKVGTWFFAIKPRNWCVLAIYNEAGMFSAQVGCIVVEIPNRSK